MGRAWYAVNDEKREFRFFTGLLEGEIPCSKQEEREAKLRLNGYTRILSNGKSKIAIFEDIDKEQEIQNENPNFEQIYGQQQEYQQEYPSHLYQNAPEYNNHPGYQQLLYQQQQHYYQTQGNYNQVDYANQPNNDIQQNVPNYNYNQGIYQNQDTENYQNPETYQNQNPEIGRAHV